MFAGRKFQGVALAASIAAVGLLPAGASAVTADVAKKCNLLVEKAFPPRQPGNPAAGSSKGSPQDQRDYFKKCLDNSGNMDNATDKNAK